MPLTAIWTIVTALAILAFTVTLKNAEIRHTLKRIRDELSAARSDIALLNDKQQKQINDIASDHEAKVRELSNTISDLQAKLSESHNLLDKERQIAKQAQDDMNVKTTFSPATGTRGVLERITTSKLLRVGCLWYPPFVEYKTERKTIVASGYYPDILTDLAESHNINVRFSSLKWHEAIDAILRGDVDVVACVLKSAERRARCDFVGTVFRVGVGAVVQSEQTKIRNHGDLARADVSIAVTKGEIGWAYAIENLGLAVNPQRFTVLEDKDIQMMMSLVESGKRDCALADSLSCAQFIEASCRGAQPLTDVFAKTPIHVEDNALMIAKGNPDFAAWLEAGIDAIRTQPVVTLRELEIEARYPGILHRAGAR